jgi:hypothetical protein
VTDEARQKSSKVYYWIVDYQKAFKIVHKHLLMEQLRTMGITNLLISAVMWIDKTVVGRFHTSLGIPKSIMSNIGVEQGCSISPTLFRVYIDEQE